MKVDVVVCVKNQAADLSRVLTQITHSIPFENLIVIYGSSNDCSKEIAEQFTANVYWDGDKGLGAARNLGIKKATSEVVVMIDSDVILTDGWFRQLSKQFGNPKVAAVNGTCLYGYGCKPLELYWEYLRQTTSVNVGCHNTMFSRKAILSVGNFDETIRGAGEDYELYSRLKEAGFSWVWVRNATVYHPMNMWDFLKHVYWWSRGRSQLDQLRAQIADTSLFRTYCRLVYSLPKSVWEGVRLSILVHPLLIFYFPLINLVRVWGNYEEFRKLTSIL